MQLSYKQFAMILLLNTCYADNQVYQSMDKNGNLVIGNTPKGQVMELPPLTIIPAKNMQKPLNRKELTRIQILQEELTAEQKALANNEYLLKNTTDKTQQVILQDAIKEHKKNINILQKQLGS